MSSKDDNKLNTKQKLFCEEYIKTLNATRSYMKVYNCTLKSAETQGWRLLQNVKIKNYIDERLQKVEREKIADANEVLEFLTSTLRGEVKDQLGFETSVKDRIKAGELLGKRYKLFEENKNENTTSDVMPKISIEVVDNSNLEEVLFKNR